MDRARGELGSDSGYFPDACVARIGSLVAMTFPAPRPSTKPVKQNRELVPDRWQTALIVPGVLVAVMYVVQLLNSFPALNLNSLGGIHPRALSGLVGVITSPLLHGSWTHLLSNTIPLIVFGFLLMVNGAKQFIAVTVLVWLVSGLGAWLTGASGSVIIGASGIVFGWLAYLVVRGAFTRNVWQIVLGLVLLAIWGGVFWGLIPGTTGVSWQSHVFGAVGGLLAAFLVAAADGPRRRKPALNGAGLK